LECESAIDLVLELVASSFEEGEELIDELRNLALRCQDPRVRLLRTSRSQSSKLQSYSP
jgi:hypothetical protein